MQGPEGERIAQMEGLLASKEATIAALQQGIEAKDKKLRSMGKQLHETETQLEEKSRQLSERDWQLDRIKAEFGDKIEQLIRMRVSLFGDKEVKTSQLEGQEPPTGKQAPAHRPHENAAGPAGMKMGARQDNGAAKSLAATSDHRASGGRPSFPGYTTALEGHCAEIRALPEKTCESAAGHADVKPGIKDASEAAAAHAASFGASDSSASAPDPLPPSQATAPEAPRHVCWNYHRATCHCSSARLQQLKDLKPNCLLIEAALLCPG